MAFFALFISCILSACGSGTSSSSGSSGNTAAPIALGVLSNGSTLYTSTNYFPISDVGTSVSGVLTLIGGTAASYTISFGNSVLQGTQKTHTNTSRLQSTDSNGIVITPSSCVIGTIGSGSPQECGYTVSASESTSVGTYAVEVMATDSNGLVQNLGSITILVSATVAPSSNSITSYSLNGNAGFIAGTNIAVEVPYGTDVSSLVATYITTGASVAVGSTIQTNGVTANNFTSPVVYTVTAANGLTKNYNVTVTTATASDNAITAFSLNGTAGVITGTNIAVEVPHGTDVTNLVAAFTSSGTSVAVGGTTQTSGTTTNNFTSPVIYTVTAADGSRQNYTVIVTILAQPWINVGNPGFSAGSTEYTDIAFNSSINQPYVVYSDYANLQKATVMRFNGTAWVNVGNPGFSDGEVMYTTIAFNQINEPYVAYMDGGNNNKATVKKFNGNAWVNVGSAGFSDGEAYFTSLTFNPATNQPYVVYQDTGNSGKATVMNFNGTSWINVGSAGFSAGYAIFTSIAFNPVTNQPYVVYAAGENSDKATVMKF